MALFLREADVESQGMAMQDLIIAAELTKLARARKDVVHSSISERETSLPPM